MNVTKTNKHSNVTIFVHALVHRNPYILFINMLINMLIFAIEATDCSKPSSSSNDQMIADSLTEGNPHQPAFKST